MSQTVTVPKFEVNVADDQVVSYEAPGRWRRYFARIIDLFITGAAVGLLAALDFIPFLPAQNRLALSFFVNAFHMLIEYFYLTSVSTTPGKRLLGMRVEGTRGKPSDAALFLRCINVWFFGNAMGLPLIGVFTHAKAGMRLKRDKDTLWDAKCGTRVSFIVPRLAQQAEPR